MIDFWIDRLEDPFERFALQQVLGSLGELAQESLSRFADRQGWWGVSSKFYTGQDEHDLEVGDHLIGSAFVLCQTAITQVVGILVRMHEAVGGPSWIPKDKAVLLNTAASFDTGTRLSHLAIINTAANYYKHRYEWKDADWIGPPYPNKRNRNTIACAVAMGLGPRGNYMETILRVLGIYSGKLEEMGSIVGRWREDLADHLRVEGAKHGVLIHPRYPEDGRTA